MTEQSQPDRSYFVADVKARVKWNGAIWAEGWASSIGFEQGRRVALRLARNQSPFNTSELLELELDLQPDPGELDRLRARIAELEAG